MNFLFPQVLRSRHQVCVLFAGRSGFRQHTIMPGYGLDADPNAVAPADFLQHVEAFHGQTLHSGDSRDLLSLLFDDWPSGSVQQAPTGMRQQDVGIHASANAWHAGPTGSRAPQFLQQQHELQQTGVYEFRAQPQSLLPPADATGLQSRQQLNFSTSSAAGTHPSSGSGGSGSTPAASATAAVSSKACRGKQTKADSSEQGGSKVSRWKQSKAKMGALETQAAEAQQMANKMEGENLVLKLRALAMEHTVAAREKQVNILSEHSARRHSSGASGLSTHSSWSDPTNHAGSGGITVGLGTGQGSASASDLAIVSVSALAAKLRRFIGEASVLLLQITDGEGTPAKQQATQMLAHMVNDFCTEMGTVFVLNTQTQFQILTCRVDQPDAGPSTPPPEHWDMVLKQLDINPSQIMEVGACWELNGHTMTKLQAEVETLRNSLAVAVAQSNTTLVAELQKGLSTALLNQALSCRAMAFILFGRVLTPVQTAKAIVHSFPYFPNARELIARIIAMPRPALR